MLASRFLPSPKSPQDASGLSHGKEGGVPYLGGGMGSPLLIDNISQETHTCSMKLVPTKNQHQALLETMRMFNKATNYVALVAFAEKSANKFALQKVVYGELRTTYQLPSQLAIRCILPLK